MHSHGIIAGDTLEPKNRGALETGTGNTGRTKHKEQEREIYVQLSEDHSDPELEHIEKVKIISIRDVDVCKCGYFFLHNVHVQKA